MKTLPPVTSDTPSLDALRAAVGRLHGASERRFGTMSPAQMLRHCSGFIELYLGRVPVSAPIRWIARAVGPLFLKRVVAKSPLDTPKGLTTLPALRSTPGEEPDLEAERARFLALLDEVDALEGPQPHVLYGTTEARTLVDLVRHHTAHHFHQFGLLDDVG